MSDWVFEYDGWNPDAEKLREALCTLGNGYFCTRGAAPGSTAGEIHYPGTYRAGLYDRRETTIRQTTVENESLVNLPNWLWLEISLEGVPLRPESMDVIEYAQELDLRCAVLTRKLRLRDDQGRETRITERRLVSMADMHLGALEITVTPVDWSGSIEVVSGIDGRVENTLVERYRDLETRHLDPAGTEEVDAESLLLTSRTTRSRIRIAEAVRTRFRQGGERFDPERSVERTDDRIAHRTTVEVEPEAPLTAEKVVALYTSLDRAIFECSSEARRALRRADDFDRLLERHVVRWDHLWERCGIDVGGGAGTQRVLRLYTAHLLQTASEHTRDLDVGVPARGWTGEAYRGHIFWDELFIFPTLGLRLPEVARSLLLYRHRRLGEARRAARDAGYEGAMFPWQSGSNGREEAQELHLNPESGRWLPDNTHLQRHINAAIPYNVWHYYQATGDVEFLSFYGAELILETARFWGSIAQYDHTLDRFRIRGVLGPDEFHDAYPDAEEPGLSDNAYTNVMATWVLACALEVLESLPEHRRKELQENLPLHREDIDRWEEVSRKMYVPFHGNRIISQFEGWDELEELDWERLREEHDDIHRLDRILEAEEDSPNRYKASKQADVLMLFYLFSAPELEGIFDRLGYDWSPDRIPETIDYYLDRTSHGSTLSAVVHSWVLSRRDREGSWQFFRRSVESDVSDVQGGTTPEGVHLGAMAGTVDLATRCYTGVEAREDVLHVDPAVPPELEPMTFRLQYRDVWIEMKVTRTRARLRALPGHAPAVDIAHRGRRRELAPGDTLELAL